MAFQAFSSDLVATCAVLAAFVLFLQRAKIETKPLLPSVPEHILDAASEALCTLLVVGFAGLFLTRFKFRSSSTVALRKAPPSERPPRRASASATSATSLRGLPERRTTTSKRSVSFDGCALGRAPVVSPEAASAERRGLWRAAAPARERVFTQEIARRPAVAVSAATRDGLKEVQLHDTMSSSRFSSACAERASVYIQPAQSLLATLRALSSRRCFREALTAYDSKPDDVGNKPANVWSLLLVCAVECRDFKRCKDFFQKLMQSAMPSTNDFVNIVRYYAHERDAAGLHGTIEDLRCQGFIFDSLGRNRALSVCTQKNVYELAEVLADDQLCGITMDVIGYNTLMKVHARASMTERCLQIYRSMQEKGIQPSEVTFGILLDTCIDAGQFQRASRIFEDLRASGLALNVVHYTTLIKGMLGVGQFDDAMGILEEMSQSPKTKPDLLTFSTLVKAHADHGNIADAIHVLERMIEQGIVPDHMVFNMVLRGCCVKPMQPPLIFHVFDALVSHGLQASTATLSILVKALTTHSDGFAAAIETLDAAPTKMKVWPEARLYAQLAQACSKAGKGGLAFDTYAALARAAKRGVQVDEATNYRMSRLCSACGRSSRASQLYQAITATHGRVSES